MALHVITMAQMACFSFPYYFTIPNSEFLILNSKFWNSHYEVRNSKLWTICNVGKWYPLIYFRGYCKLTNKHKRQHDLNWQTYKCFYLPFGCIDMTPCCVISCLINYLKQSSGKMIYVCYWVDYQLNRRKKNIFVFINQRYRWDLKFFLLKKWGQGRVFQETGVYIFIIERREIVFLWNTVSSRYFKVEVHPKLLIFQSNFSGLR